jgi:DNA-binding MarR family transcriptional regulator/GNAT superfamily N-acetyltransferase
VDVVDVVRRFNRAYTQRIGVLADPYLGLGRPLGPSRLLFEIDPTSGTGVAELRRRTGLDSGFVSRMLHQLENDGFVTVGRVASDGRQRIARLTARGRRQRTLLDDRSQQLAAALVEPLSERQRGDLAAALTTAERLLRAATVTFDAVDPAGVDATAALSSYFAELDVRFRAGFVPSDGGADHDAAAMSAPHGAFVVVRDDRDVIGCGGVLRIDRRTAEIKRMWIGVDWRGLGLGRRLLVHLENVARDLGYRRVVLDTNETLCEAIAMYRSHSYVAIDRYNDNPYAHHWFAKELGAR